MKVKRFVIFMTLMFLASCQTAPNVQIDVPEFLLEPVNVDPVEWVKVKDILFEVDLLREGLGQCNLQLQEIKTITNELNKK